MVNDIVKDAESRMRKSVEALKHQFSKVRTGRAHTSLLDHIMVPYYGNETPLKQVANVAVEDARTLTVTPWEKNMVQAIEKAILTSDLGLNPATAGTVIRLPLPSLTEERRKDLVRIVRHEAEQGRVAVRIIRRDANNELKEALKEKLMSEDDEHQGIDRVQDITDRFIKEVDRQLQEKEKDLLSV
ncbi:MAG: ribosome recycling factor [Methylococcales bacterium]